MKKSSFERRAVDKATKGKKLPRGVNHRKPEIEVEAELRSKQWVASVLRGGRPPEQLGTVTAPNADAAIAKAIETFGIADPERRRRVIVRPVGK
jgi:hypothetical protein